MQINKILKVYFVLLMAITTLGAVTTNNAVVSYYADVINAFESKEPMKTAKVIEKIPEETKKEITITLNNKLEDSYGRMGASGVNLMNLKIDKASKSSNIKPLLLRVNGVDAKKILAVYLYEGSTLLEKASVYDGGFKFTGLEDNLSQEISKAYQVKVDLATDLQIGDRFRMDVDSPVNSRGPYFTIVGGAL